MTANQKRFLFLLATNTVITFECLLYSHVKRMLQAIKKTEDEDETTTPALMNHITTLMWRCRTDNEMRGKNLMLLARN